MWKQRTIPCPWNSGKMASEVILLHHEQFKIPESLARFAVKQMMWTVVKKMLPSLRKFQEKRRLRCDKFSLDSQGYGSSTSTVLYDHKQSMLKIRKKHNFRRMAGVVLLSSIVIYSIRTQ